MRLSSVSRVWHIGLLIACGGMPAQTMAEANEPLAEVFAAVRAGDCTRLGDIVNGGIERRAVPLLYVAGLMFDEGLCVAADPARSKKFYEAAAATVDRPAAIRIGLHYALGEGLPRSYALAGRWLLHATALELRALEHAAADVVPEDRLASLRATPGLANYTRALPERRLGQEAEWTGYLISVHFLASRMMRYPRGALLEGLEAGFIVESCPARESIRIERESVSAPYRADSAMRAEIERSYRRAQETLPRPAAAPASDGCFQAPISFKIR